MTRTARRPRRPAQTEPDDDQNFTADPEEGDETPSRRRSATRPSRRAAPSPRENDEDAPRGRRRGGDDDGDDEPAARETVQGGWGTWRQRKAETSGFADDFKVEYKEKYLIMFLDDAPFAAFNEHWIEEMPKGKKKSYICIGKECPLCKALGEKPKAQAMFNILEFIKTDDGREPVHKVWQAGSGVVQEIEENADDPGLEGNYFRVSKSKTGRNGPTKYTVVPVKDRDVEDPDDWNMELLSDDEYDEWQSKKFDKTYVKMPSRKSLQDIAEEVLSLDD